MKLGRFFRAIATLSCLGVSLPAHALPVTFLYSGSIFAMDSPYPGISVGDAMVFEIFADNGGSSLAGQTWDNSDYRGARLTLGSGSLIVDYDADLGLCCLPLGDGFAATTDASGNVTILALFDLLNANGPVYLSDVIASYNHPASPEAVAALYYEVFPGALFDRTVFRSGASDSMWTVRETPAQVPLPSAGILLVFTLAAIGFTRKNRKRFH